MLPNFLIAGGVASGTSFLSTTLSNHPEIYLPRIQRPEPNFFHYTHKYNQGIDWYVETWFSEVKNEKAVGERSSLLLTSNNAAKRIVEILPDIKLIFCLRNPVERAWGNYRFTVLEGLEPLSFEEAIDREDERMKSAEGIWSEVQPHAYTTRSMYSRGLLEYMELFGKENILLLKSEDLGKHPEMNIVRVCKFLGVDPSVKLPFPPNYTSPSVKDPIVQMELRKYFGDKFSNIVEHTRAEEGDSSLVLSNEDEYNLKKLKLNLTSGKNPLSEVLRLRLQKIFSGEIGELKDIVDFSIDDWV